jgi:50S ribosomal protein L16 3-hydroxylase
VEQNTRLKFPQALTPEDFLCSFWQQKPLLMPGALTDYQCPLGPEELAGLACEDSVESRLIVEDPPGIWSLRAGPFSAADFSSLPPRGWTLLVQDVDKHLPEVAVLLHEFRFIPHWRVDDVMISYAADAGSVGPHTDQYDVFLIQASGRRHWRINSSNPPDAAIRDDNVLRILAEFTAEQEWTLEPGDLLYLPPGVAHWGIADGPCMTCSVGFRAPSWRELYADWSDYLIQRIPDDAYYRDPSLPALALSGEIPESVFAAVAQQLEALQRTDSEELKRWFGRFVSETKPQFEPPTPAHQLNGEAFQQRFRADGRLHLHPYLRTAVARTSGGRWVLFAGGREFPVPAACCGTLQPLTEAAELRFEACAQWLRRVDCRELLTELFNLGYLVGPDD